MDDSGKSSVEVNMKNNKLRQNFTIPKIKRDAEKVCLIRCMPQKREYTEIMNVLDKGRLNTNCELNSSWEFSNVNLVINNDLEKWFSEKRHEMKECGRSNRELEEKYCFLVVSSERSAIICNRGLSVGNMSTKVLGNPQMGVYLFRHIDVALNFAHTRDLASNTIVVFKVLLGKARIVPVLGKKKMALDPTPNFDSHISKQPPIWKDPFEDQVKKSLVYMYEYDTSSKPVKMPRHCLPTASINATFITQKTVMFPARLPAKPTSGSGALANCTVAQRIGKGKDATVIFRSVHQTLTKPSLSKSSQNESLQNTTHSVPFLEDHQTCPSHMAVPVFPNQITPTNSSILFHQLCMSLQGLVTSCKVITSKSIKDPRLLKRGEHEVVNNQYPGLEQVQNEFVSENEKSNNQNVYPGEECFENWENNVSNTPLYLSFEEARLSHEKNMAKHQPPNKKKPSSVLSSVEKKEDTNVQCLQNQTSEEKLELPVKPFTTDLNHLTHKKTINAEDVLKLILRLEKSPLQNTKDSKCKIITQSDNIEKINESSYLHRNKCAISSERRNETHSESKQCTIPKPTWKDKVPNVCLNGSNNKYLSPDKKGSTSYKKSKLDKMVLCNTNESGFQNIKTSLAASKRHLDKHIQSKSNVSGSRESPEKISESTSPNNYLPNTSPHQKATPPKPTKETMIKKSPEKSLLDIGLQRKAKSKAIKIQDQGLQRKAKSEPIKKQDQRAQKKDKSELIKIQDQGLQRKVKSEPIKTQDRGLQRKEPIKTQDQGLQRKEKSEPIKIQDQGLQRKDEYEPIKLQDQGLQRKDESELIKIQDQGLQKKEKSETIKIQDQDLQRKEKSDPVKIQDQSLQRKEKSEPVKIQDQGLQRKEKSDPVKIQDQGLQRKEKSEPVKIQDQGLQRKEKSEHIKKELNATSIQITEVNKLSDYQSATSLANGQHVENGTTKHDFLPDPIHKFYRDTNEKHYTNNCGTIEPKVIKESSDVESVAKNVHTETSSKSPNLEKTGTQNSCTEINMFVDTEDFQHVIELENRIDWKGIFGLEQHEAEKQPDLQKHARKLKEPCGLRIFPDMEITITNTYVFSQPKSNSLAEDVNSSVGGKGNIKTTFELKKGAPSDPQKVEADVIDSKVSSKAISESHSLCDRIIESVLSDEEATAQKQAIPETRGDSKLAYVKTGPILGHSTVRKKRLNSTRKHSVIFKKSVRRINKFSQSEKNIKAVLGLLSGEIPLCKSKRVSKRLDRAILHLRKAHKRVQKSLQLVAKSGQRRNVTRTSHMEKTCRQEGVKSDSGTETRQQNGEKTVTQFEMLKSECGDKKMLPVQAPLNTRVSDVHQQKSPTDRKYLSKSTQAMKGILEQDSVLVATLCNSSPKKLPTSPLFPNRTVDASESSGPTLELPSGSISNKENAVPVVSLQVLKSESKKVTTEKCEKCKKNRKENTSAKKYCSCYNKTKLPKRKTDSASEKSNQKRLKDKQIDSITSKNIEQPRWLLEELSMILQKASETDNVIHLQNCRSWCKEMLPFFVKSFEGKQNCAWKDVIVDRKLLFSNNLKTCFQSTLKPQAVESFIELQMMIETTQFIENRIHFIEGKPTFRSLLWYDASLYRELLMGENGYQQQSHFYTAFQEKLKHSAASTLENLCGQISGFLKEIHENNSSYYVFLKYKRELKECEDVLKHECDHSTFSLSVPFSCGVHLGDTVDDLATLQKSTLEIISRFIQLPRVDPGKKEHALCLLEIISAKINFMRTSVSQSMDLSLFGIEHLLFDAAKMMAFRERKTHEIHTNTGKEIVRQINSTALTKLFQVFCVSGEDVWVAGDGSTLLDKCFNSFQNLQSPSKKGTFFVGKIIDQARHADARLLQQLIRDCQQHLASQIKCFQILQECDTEKAIIKNSNVMELCPCKESFVTLIKTEAVDAYIELAMTSETLHFLKCLTASQTNQDRRRGLLWYDSTLFSEVVHSQEKIASMLQRNMMPSAIEVIENTISDIQSELEIISSCSDSVNYSYAFQIMTRELSELSELKRFVLTSTSAMEAYIHVSPCVVSLHYGSSSSDLDYNYNQFSDFLSILMSASKKDLGKMAHTMKIMKTIELSKTVTFKPGNSPFELVTCQILQNRLKHNDRVNKKQEGSKAKMLNVPMKRKCASFEYNSPKKIKLQVIHSSEKSAGKEKKENLMFSSSLKGSSENKQTKLAQHPLKDFCKRSSVQKDVKARTSAKCSKPGSGASKAVDKSNTKTSLPSQQSLSPTKLNMSASVSANTSPRPSQSADYFPSASNSTDEVQEDGECSESSISTDLGHENICKPSDVCAVKINDETSVEKVEDTLGENHDVISMDECCSEAGTSDPHSDDQEGPAAEKKHNSELSNEQPKQSNSTGWNNQPVTQQNNLYTQYPGSSNPWLQSLYSWYQHNGSDNTLSQAYQGAVYDAQNTNHYNQSSTFSVPNSYSANHPYGQIYPAYGSTELYRYGNSASASNQNSVSSPYSYSSSMMAGWLWNSWQ
ncbi:testis-expressed protein 15 [Hyperolius riggenbachi]|uniref:testis-expressed protein 15 n=1 Tax=Hyperolius riggenbachi TaxID=752182 RepID=UPI0035A32910